MFACSCKRMKNYMVQFVLEALDQACGLGDAPAVSYVLQENWRVETGVYEAGAQALLTVMSAAMELDCSAEEEECLRIAVWERGAFAVIAVMQVFTIPLPDFVAPLFMALWLCDCC